MRSHETCAGCGFDGGAYDDAQLLAALTSLGDRWRESLGAAGPELRIRPAPATWSAIEYAAHSRDITAIHAYGVEQALTRAEPAFPPLPDDAADAAAAGYGDLDPVEVAASLDRAARRLAQLAESAGVDQWTRGLSVGTQRSDVRDLLEHALHDALHHLADVASGLAALR